MEAFRGACRENRIREVSSLSAAHTIIRVTGTHKKYPRKWPANKNPELSGVLYFLMHKIAAVIWKHKLAKAARLWVTSEFFYIHVSL